MVGFGIAFRPLTPSSSLFRENPLAGWKVTISANRRIGIPLLLHAREGVSYLRPSLNSPSVKSDQRSPARLLFLSPSFSLRFFFSTFVSSFFLPFLLSLFLLLFNFHCKPRNDRHYPYTEILGARRKSYFGGRPPRRENGAYDIKRNKKKNFLRYSR